MYRGEQLPRALPWDTVRALLQSIDRSSPMGLRDYAMLLLMATYGLRACEVVTLTLDDVEWRAGRLRIPQRKTRGALWLPLTDEVGTVLLDYLRQGRAALNVRRQRVPFRGAPVRSYRELFLRCRTPAGVLKPTAITKTFQAWSKRSGLAIPFQGVHASTGTAVRRGGMDAGARGSVPGSPARRSRRRDVRRLVSHPAASGHQHASRPHAGRAKPVPVSPARRSTVR